MKLPSFLSFAPLQTVKARMGLAADALGTLNIDLSGPRLSELELSRLTSAEGLDVGANEITFLRDGTIAYKNTRVLLYIRDVSTVRDDIKLPRFHVARCATLDNMIQNNRFDRYVVATQNNGQFTLSRVGNGRKRSEQVELSVCQFCLDTLTYNGFNLGQPKSERSERVDKFRIEEFFHRYPLSYHLKRPKYNEDNAPLNEYTADFHEIASSLKLERGWTCEKCGVVLSAAFNRRFLHVHHLDANKANIRTDNLKVVCIGCHAEEFNHSHMKATAEYANFLRLRLWRGKRR